MFRVHQLLNHGRIASSTRQSRFTKTQLLNHDESKVKYKYVPRISAGSDDDPRGKIKYLRRHQN